MTWPSGSVVVTGSPTSVPGAAFSGTSRWALSRTGPVAPVPLPDQALSPSALTASTCTSWTVAGSRSAMVVLGAVPLTAWSVQSDPPAARYRTRYPVMAEPRSSGAVQVTSSVVAGSDDACATRGAAGASGTLASVTVMVRLAAAAWPCTVHRTAPA